LLSTISFSTSTRIPAVRKLAFYQECAAERRKLMKEYAQCYGPLTVDDALETDGSTWKWMEQPFPWEQEGGCR